MLVQTSQIIPHTDSHRYSVRKMVDVLKRQGQIEPLQVTSYAPGVYITHQQDIHGAEIVLAAQTLGWRTILIVETSRYIP